MEFDAALDMVSEFHKHIGSPVATTPQLLPCSPIPARWLALQIQKLSRTASQGAGGDALLGRVALALEELAEWVEAHADQDSGAAADAWADRCYVLLGDAVAAGLPAAELFQEVHLSNMTKLRGVRTGVGKAVRGWQYRAPRIREVVEQETTM